jgi:hypothetical protein
MKEALNNQIRPQRRQPPQEEEGMELNEMDALPGYEPPPPSTEPPALTEIVTSDSSSSVDDAPASIPEPPPVYSQDNQSNS